MEMFKGKEFIQVCKVSFLKAWSMSRKSESLILRLKLKKKTDHLIQHLGMGIQTQFCSQQG